MAPRETHGRDFGDSSSVEIGARVYLDAPSVLPKALRYSAKRVHPHSRDVLPAASTGVCISQLRHSQRGTWGYGWRPRLPKAEGKQLLQGAHIRVNLPYSRSTGAGGYCSPLPRILDASDVSIRAESVSVDGDGAYFQRKLCGDSQVSSLPVWSSEQVD